MTVPNRVLVLALAAFWVCACTPPPATKTSGAAPAPEADDDEPERAPTRFDVGAIPGPTKDSEDTCGPAKASRNAAVAVLEPAALERTVLTPSGYTVTEPSDAAAATAPKANPLVPSVRRMYRKGAGAPLSLELRDAVRQCPLDNAQALAQAHSAKNEGHKAEESSLGPASVGSDRFTAFVSGRCILSVEGPGAKRMAPRLVDAQALEEACAARTPAAVPR